MNLRRAPFVLPFVLLPTLGHAFGCTPPGASEATQASTSYLSDEDAALDFRLVAVEAPKTLRAGVPVEIAIRVENNGGTTWDPAAKDRLAATESNAVAWSFAASASDDPDRVSSGGKAGYANSLRDARVFLDRAVAPGDEHVFRFTITAPASGAGAVRLGLRMVRDGVTFYGDNHTREIPIETPKDAPKPAPAGPEPVKPDPLKPDPNLADAGVKGAREPTTRPPPVTLPNVPHEPTGEPTKGDDDDSKSDPQKPKTSKGAMSVPKKKLTGSLGCTVGGLGATPRPDFTVALFFAGLVLTALGLRGRRS